MRSGEGEGGCSGGGRNTLAGRKGFRNWWSCIAPGSPLLFPPLSPTRSGRGRISYDDMSDSEVRELNALAKRFLTGGADIEELPSDSLKAIREAYKQVRGRK